MIRQMIAVPETFRAMPQKKKPVRNYRPEPDMEILRRHAQLIQQGINADLRYDRFSKSWYIEYQGQAPVWKQRKSAVQTWKEAAGI